MGKKHSDETKRRISEAKKGKPRLFSRNPERTRALMSAAKKGNQFPVGHKHSDATRAKMKATWAAKRAARQLAESSTDGGTD